LSAGTLNINTSSALGTGTFTINSGTIDNTQSQPVTITNAIAQGGDYTFNGTQTMALTGAYALGSADRQVTVNGTAPLMITGGVAGGGRKLTKQGTGRLILTGANTYPRPTVITGVLQVNSLAAGAAASNIGQSSNVAANLVLNSGTLRVLGNVYTS